MSFLGQIKIQQSGAKHGCQQMNISQRDSLVRDPIFRLSKQGEIRPLSLDSTRLPNVRVTLTHSSLSISNVETQSSTVYICRRSLCSNNI